jgi:hypothetical protein
MDDSSGESASEAALYTDVEYEEMLTTEPKNCTVELISKIQNALWRKMQEPVDVVVAVRKKKKKEKKEKTKQRKRKRQQHIVDKTALKHFLEDKIYESNQYKQELHEVGHPDPAAFCKLSDNDTHRSKHKSRRCALSYNEVREDGEFDEVSILCIHRNFAPDDSIEAQSNLHAYRYCTCCHFAGTDVPETLWYHKDKCHDIHIALVRSQYKIANGDLPQLDSVAMSNATLEIVSEPYVIGVMSESSILEEDMDDVAADIAIMSSAIIARTRTDPAGTSFMTLFDEATV